MSSVPTCQHLKVNGIQCGCPALRNRRFCYFHDESRKRERASMQRQHKLYAKDQLLLLPVLEDANAVQVALMQTIDGLLDGRLNERQTGLILYALQTASANLKHTTFKADEPERAEPWVTDLLTFLRGNNSPAAPGNALVGAGDSPARASEARLVSDPSTTHVDPADPGRKAVQSSMSRSSTVNAVVPNIQASAEPSHPHFPLSPFAQAVSVPLCLCGESPFNEPQRFSVGSPLCYNHQFPNFARRNSYGRRFDSSTAPGRPYRR